MSALVCNPERVEVPSQAVILRVWLSPCAPAREVMETRNPCWMSIEVMVKTTMGTDASEIPDPQSLLNISTWPSVGE